MDKEYMDMDIWTKFDKLDFKLPIFNDGPTRVDWSDSYFIKEYAHTMRVQSRPTPVQSVIFAKSFLNFYVFNDVNPKMEDVFLGLLMSIKTKTGAFLISEDMISKETALILAAPETPKELEGNWKSLFQGPGGARNTISYSASNAKKWYNELWQALDKEFDAEMSQITINYLGFILIQCMRMSVKSKNSIVPLIMSTTHKTFAKLWMGAGPNRTLPPCDSATVHMSMSFERLKPTSIKLMTYMVYSYVFANATVRDEVRSIFEAGGLLTLSNVGLGCIGWLLKAAEYKNVTMSTLLDYLAFVQYRDIIKDINAFIKNFMNNENENTWPWSRMLADGAFLELSNKRNYNFVGILMAITIDGRLDSPMWDIAQFKNEMTTVRKEFCSKYAIAIAKNIQDMQKSDALDRVQL